LIGRLALSFFLGGASILYGQAIPTASRAGDAQIGVGYALGWPDYVQQNFHGVTAYADFNFRPHFGVEAEFHQINNTSGYQSFERTFAIGGRYLRTYGRLVPYVKGMVGRGTFEYPYGLTELNYTMYAGGIGADFNLASFLRVRGEYEIQKWTDFPNGGLAPQIVTVGLAYHFAGNRRTR
jgi:hypothetical protein